MNLSIDNSTFLGTNIIIKRVPRDSHWKWMADGWADFKLSLVPSLKIGAIVVLFSILIVYLLYATGFTAFIPAAFGAFIIIGPLIATLIYGISRKLEETRKVTQLRSVNLKPVSPTQVGLIGFALLFLVLAWVRVATLLYAVTIGFGSNYGASDFINFVLQTPQGLTMLVVGTIVGGGLALIGFAISAISIPLAFDRDIDAFSAMAISAKAVIKNTTASLSWAFVISMIVGLSLFFGLLPIIVAFPWLGHATWHAYRDLIE